MSITYNGKKGIQALYDFDFNLQFDKLDDRDIVSMIKEPTTDDIARLDSLYERYYEVSEIYQKILKDSYTDPELYRPGWLEAYAKATDEFSETIKEHVDEILEFDWDKYGERIKEIDEQNAKEHRDYVAEVNRRY